MSNMSALNAPYGSEAPCQNLRALSAPISDTTSTARSFVCLTAGTVSVRNEKGNDVTFAAFAGLQVFASITHVLAATTVDLLLYED